MNTDFLAFLTGLVTGILSAFGIGGGTLLLLVMTLFLGVEASIARCINLLYFLPTALCSLYYHHKNGYLHKDAIVRTVPWGLVLAIGGAVISAHLHTDILRRLFGVYLLWAGITMLLPKKKILSSQNGKSNAQ